MNRDHGGEGGIPRRQQRLASAPSLETPADWRGANGAKTEKLRRRALGRLAHTQGFELRHSAYGYALIDAARHPVEDRHDLSLDEVESKLAPS
jgi:hypothetical protein